MKADQERVAKLLNDTVTLLCKNGLIYKNNLTVQGLLGITLDKNEVFIVHINESIGASVTVDNSQKQKQTLPPITNVVDLTKIADPPITPSHQHQQSTLRYHNTVSSPVLGQPRKQRPQMINQTMLLQRNELLQQVQNRLRMNTSMMPQAMGPMGPMPVPIAPMPTYQPRQPVSRPANHRQRPVINPRRPSSLQQNQAPISLLDEDDVVIVGTGREEPHSSPRRSQGARIGRNPQPSKNFRMHSNESQPIVIPQDCSPFHDASLGMGATYPPHRMQTMEGLHPGYVEPKNFLGEIVIEPTNSSDVDITTVLGFPRSSRQMEDCRMELGGSHGAEVHSDGRKPEENNPQDRVTVYLDVAEDGVQNDFKPCCSNVEAQQKEQLRINDTPREFRKAGEETINLDSLGLHMLTEGEDDPHSSASSWHCKVPTCQAFYAESSQLASHYIHEHTRQLDLSIKDSAGTETPGRSEIDADSSCPEAWQDSSRAETIEDLTACPSTRSDATSESNDRHEAPGSVVRSLSDNSSHSEPRHDDAQGVHSMWMTTSSIDRAETRTHSRGEPDSRQEAVSLPEVETFPEMTSFIQPQEQVHEATTFTNTQNDTSYLRRDFLPLNVNPGMIVDHFSIPGNPENQMLQIAPDPQQPLCFDEATDPRDGDAAFSGNRREAGTDFDRMECDPTRTFEEARRADDDLSRSPCLTIDNMDDNS